MGNIAYLEGIAVMGISDDWLHSHLVHHKPKRKIYVADYAILMLKDGYLVSIPVKSLQDIETVGKELEEAGFKKPRFPEAFTPVNATIYKMELHDKQTKTGKPMYRFYAKEDITGTEHMVIAFDETAFVKHDRVVISMGNYGKQAKRIGATGWDDDGEEPLQPRANDDIPF
jgi:hypothetical protein